MTLMPFVQLLIRFRNLMWIGQERVLRWAREKLGLKAVVPPAALTDASANHPAPPVMGDAISSHKGRATDIKTFVASKNPSSNNEFTATVAYYYRFEAPETERKESITPEDLQEACRQCARDRLTKPSQTLVNACYAGLIDKAGDRGAYSINTVGENLVAMALPADGAIQRKNSATHQKPSKNPHRRTPTKRTVAKAKKTSNKKSKGS